MHYDPEAVLIVHMNFFVCAGAILFYLVSFHQIFHFGSSCVRHSKGG